jgi:hypothetical protein
VLELCQLPPVHNKQEINSAQITHSLFLPVPFGIKTMMKKKKKPRIKKALKT